jgi:hypothetical protein
MREGISSPAIVLNSVGSLLADGTLGSVVRAVAIREISIFSPTGGTGASLLVR